LLKSVESCCFQVISVETFAARLLNSVETC
jgi:hypothetical protein